MNITHFSTLLAKASTTQQAESILSAYLAPFGFRAFAFTYYAGHVKSGRKLRYHMVSDTLRPWHVYYLEQNYADADRTLEESHLMTLPLWWDVNEQLAQAKNKREQRIRRESIEFGINKGLSIPVHGPQHDFVSLTLHQFRGETCLEKFSSQQFEWLAATHIYYHCIRKILNLDSQKSSPYRLTNREEQCLLLTAQSWRVETIAKELKISARTVNFHIQNANRKLGTRNKYQASHRYFIDF